MYDNMQVANQRWLTVGALLVVGVGGLLAADAVSEPKYRISCLQLRTTICFCKNKQGIQ